MPLAGVNNSYESNYGIDVRAREGVVAQKAGRSNDLAFSSLRLDVGVDQMILGAKDGIDQGI